MTSISIDLNLTIITHSWPLDRQQGSWDAIAFNCIMSQVSVLILILNGYTPKFNPLKVHSCLVFNHVWGHPHPLAQKENGYQR